MRLPDLTFRPTPAWLRYQREAKARQRQARLVAWRSVVCFRLTAWWKEWRIAVLVAGLLLVAFVPMLASAAADRDRLLTTVDDAERRANDFGELALALTRGKRTSQISIRLAADGPDEALRQIERLRELLLAQRGEVRP